MADTLPGVDNAPTDRRASCSRCGRELRHPDSVAVGIGPTCRAKQARETTHQAVTVSGLGDLPGVKAEIVTVPPSRLL